MKIFHLCLANDVNVGDIALRQAAQFELKKAFPDCEFVEVDLSRALWSEKGIDFLNQNADLIVLGPGGIFLKHDTQSEWLWDISAELIEKISVPIFTYSAGYNAFKGDPSFSENFSKTLNALLLKSVLFTLRHKDDIEKLKPYIDKNLQNKIDFCFCPTLQYKIDSEERKENKVFGFLFAGDRFSKRHMNLRGFYEGMVKLCFKLKENNYKLKYISHMKGDDWFLNYFTEFDEIIDLKGKDIKDVCSVYNQLDYLVADRGHAQMIAFSQGVKVWTVSTHDKLASFFKDVGFDEYAFDEDDVNLADKLFESVENLDNEKWEKRHKSAMLKIEEQNTMVVDKLKERILLSRTKKD